jgi:hypothetical protein
MALRWLRGGKEGGEEEGEEKEETDHGRLLVRFMLTYPLPKKPPRTNSPILGGPIHAAVGNRQRRSDH